MNMLDEIRNGLAEFSSEIAGYEDNSDHRVYRVRVTFNNGYVMSMNRPVYASGFSTAYADLESFELMLLDNDGEFFKTEEFPDYEMFFDYALMGDIRAIAAKVAKK